MNIITIVSLCKDELHEREYVAPLVEILKHKCAVTVIRIDEMKHHIDTPIILSGTALQDNDYLHYLENLSWLTTHPFPVLGICAGMQVLVALHGGMIVQEQRIGMHDVHDINDELLHGVTQAYFLHQHSVHLSDNLKPIAFNGKKSVACKHKTFPHYGVLFHPEVRNEQIVVDFVK